MKPTAPGTYYLATCGCLYRVFSWQGKLWQARTKAGLAEEQPYLTDYETVSKMTYWDAFTRVRETELAELLCYPQKP